MDNDQLPNDIFRHLDADTMAWVRNANTKDIILAIELGSVLVDKVNNKIVCGRHVNSTNRCASSATLGQVGEDMVESILAKKYGVINNTKIAKSGDLTLFINHNKIVVEVKNYANVVPTSEVEKFRRDLNTTSVNGGVFISLKSPIRQITENFTIRFESTETKVIPVVYVVSSDEHVISTAVSMVSQLITSCDYINTEIYSRDKMMSSFYIISDKINDVSRARDDLQVNLHNIISQIMKTTTNIVAAECGIKNALYDVKNDLFYTVDTNIDPAKTELDKNSSFCRQSAQTKDLIFKVMRSVQEIVHKIDIGGSPWRLSAKKCQNTSTGISFTFLANKTVVSIPRIKISSEAILSCLNIFTKKVTIDDCLHLDLDETTIDWICELIITGMRSERVE